MIKNNKKSCINISTDTYSGKEQSPKGFGYSADGFDINYEKTGQDNRIWIVQIKNNRKVWVRKNTNISNITHEEPIINDENKDSLLITAPDNKNLIESNDTNESNESNELNELNESKGSKEKEKEKEKKTDYNIFLKYYLEIIKIINETKPKSERKTNKELFNETVSEWKIIKKLINDKKNNNKNIIQDYINKWNEIKQVPTELIAILQK